VLTIPYKARSAVLLILGLSSQKMKGLRKLKLEKRRLTVKSTEGGGWEDNVRNIILITWCQIIGSKGLLTR
jgi:hypothetical protein